MTCIPINEIEAAAENFDDCSHDSISGAFIAGAKFADEKLKHEIDRLKLIVKTCKNDYWFMSNLIEHYGSDKEQVLKDLLERMKFRKPLFNEEVL